jgi:hypothetical protein
MNKVKSAVKRGRKTTGLTDVTGLPMRRWNGFYFCESKKYPIFFKLFLFCFLIDSLNPAPVS